MKHKIRITAAILSLSLFGASASTAQTANDRKPGEKSVEAQRLFDEISHMDSVMFDAYNAHDVDKLRTVFAEDVEFYHDKGGLVLFNEIMTSFKSVFENNKGLRRDLVKGSLEVYPIKDYGAIEIGSHKFCHVENGKDDCGVFKFVHIWRKKDGNWKVTRVVSYGH